MNIVPAQPGDAAELTRIAQAAKRHWRYPENWLVAWREALTVTPEYLAANPAFVAREGSGILGFCALRVEGQQTWLDHLWVWPEAMQHGVGRSLFQQAEKYAREAGAVSLKIVGDPNAEGFYLRMGAVVCGRESAPVAGQERWLPVLCKALG